MSNNWIDLKFPNYQLPCCTHLASVYSCTAEHQSVELQLQSGQHVAPAQNIHFTVLAYMLLTVFK